MSPSVRLPGFGAFGALGVDADVVAKTKSDRYPGVSAEFCTTCDPASSPVPLALYVLKEKKTADFESPRNCGTFEGLYSFSSEKAEVMGKNRALYLFDRFDSATGRAWVVGSVPKMTGETRDWLFVAQKYYVAATDRNAIAGNALTYSRARGYIYTGVNRLYCIEAVINTAYSSLTVDFVECFQQTTGVRDVANTSPISFIYNEKCEFVGGRTTDPAVYWHVPQVGCCRNSTCRRLVTYTGTPQRGPITQRVASNAGTMPGATVDAGDGEIPVWQAPAPSSGDASGGGDAGSGKAGGFPVWGVAALGLGALAGLWFVLRSK